MSVPISKRKMAIIWAVVLNLPIVATATLPRLPICAIHSRRAEIGDFSADNNHGEDGVCSAKLTSRSRATATMSLSATGSRNAPKSEVCFQRRAKKPSNQSVTAASAKMMAAVQLTVCG